MKIPTSSPRIAISRRSSCHHSFIQRSNQASVTPSLSERIVDPRLNSKRPTLNSISTVINKMFTRSAFLALAALPIIARAQQVPDGVIVPFTSQLPACASLCGPLFDVQGACSEPVMPTSQSCFCGDARLQSIPQGTSDVQTVCGPASCTDTADLTKIQAWYDTFCNAKAANPTVTTSAAGSTGTGAASSGTAKPSTGVSTASQGW